jgi:hypothetical protein
MATDAVDTAIFVVYTPPVCLQSQPPVLDLTITYTFDIFRL